MAHDWDFVFEAAFFERVRSARAAFCFSSAKGETSVVDSSDSFWAFSAALMASAEGALKAPERVRSSSLNHWRAASNSASAVSSSNSVVSTEISMSASSSSCCFKALASSSLAS